MATYSSCHTERSGWIEEGAVEGRIPPELRGSLLRNGPGLFEVGGTKVRPRAPPARAACLPAPAAAGPGPLPPTGCTAPCPCSSLPPPSPALATARPQQIPQPFDGDGLLALLAIRDGRAFFANRFVRTQGFLAEQAAGRLLHRGAFSVGNPAGRGPFANPFSLDIKGALRSGGCGV